LSRSLFISATADIIDALGDDFTVTGPVGGPVTVFGIIDNPDTDIELSRQSGSSSDAKVVSRSTNPIFCCKLADADNVAQGYTLTNDGILYYMIEPYNDRDGLILVELTENQSEVASGGTSRWR